MRIFTEGDSEHVQDRERRRRLNLHQKVLGAKSVTILGGGLLGVELASVSREMGKEVYLVEGSDRLLNFMTRESSDFALRELREMGVHVILKEKVEGIEKNKVKTNNMEIESDVVVSSIGFKGPSLIQELGLTNTNGRMVVDEYLRSVDYDDVFGAGDSATMKKFVPMSAQVAVQAGNVAMRNMIGASEEPFQYKQYAVIAKVNGKYFGDLMVDS
ncbi:NAD(P)/FAD-dependent oxidoreductase [Sulfuracidifex tepidarius]|uniref:NAD(P)/FAD-dependent oxidoreductase n=1 Tax=Sulfuracidifex tepidarius TaxID=1294262 RepID=UPI00210C0AE2|nr:FAD-dependent oxidoreductase [Sulfuracidifex tepidarius]